MTVEVLLSRLQKVKQHGLSRWMASCPAHGDRTPSLAIQVIDDGRILIKCFAGCGASDVMNSVGLSLTDLFPDGAIAKQLKGWAQMSSRSEMAAKEQASTILAIAESDRKNGRKLTKAEKELEAKAYLERRK